MRKTIDEFLFNSKLTINDALHQLNKVGFGFLLIIEDNKRLCGVVTDGDVRRAFLKNIPFESKISEIMHADFVSAKVTDSRKKILSLLNEKISFVPLLNSSGVPVDYVTATHFRHFPLIETFLKGNELEYITECVTTGWISSQGRFVTRFEEMFAELHGISPELSVAVSNGTTALHLALVSLGVGPGDEVIVPDFTFAATANAVLHAGATPVLVDVESDTWALCPEEVKQAITPKTKAIIPVHLYGHPAKMNELMAIAKAHNLLVIEDCAESLGAKYDGKLTGTIGDAGTFSFFGNKTITTGEGGMVLFKNSTHAFRSRMLRDHGMSKEKRYWHLETGFNYRMTNMQAAIGVAQLERFEQILNKKAGLAKIYRSQLQEIWQLEMPPNRAPADPTCWIFTLLLKESCGFDRSKIMDALLSKGVETRSTFFPLHQMPAFSRFVRSDCKFTFSKALASRGISLPSSVTLSKEDINTIAKSIKDVINLNTKVQK
jgi:perosamine synthetase